MRLTRYTDYALRVLLYLGTQPERTCAISEMARAYGISQNHLMKVVHDLGKAGYVTGVRGRFGGIRLARPPLEINIGALVRHTEEDFDLVDCPSCVIAPVCGLSSALSQALNAFMAVLDRQTLADLLAQRQAAMTRIFGLVSPAAAPGSSPEIAEEQGELHRTAAILKRQAARSSPVDRPRKRR